MVLEVKIRDKRGRGVTDTPPCDNIRKKKEEVGSEGNSFKGAAEPGLTESMKWKDIKIMAPR